MPWGAITSSSFLVHPGSRDGERVDDTCLSGTRLRLNQCEYPPYEGTRPRLEPLARARAFFWLGQLTVNDLVGKKTGVVDRAYVSNRNEISNFIFALAWMLSHKPYYGILPYHLSGRAAGVLLTGTNLLPSSTTYCTGTLALARSSQLRTLHSYLCLL